MFRSKVNFTLAHITALLFPCISSSAQSPYISEVLAYRPAPGQFINTTAWGIPEKASSLIGGLDGGISLGAYGGYIIVGFDHSIENHPDNPYGIDFTVFGNPLGSEGAATWSEAGIVMVMKDENKNGQADDTWYELAGSDHYFSSTVKAYQITYTNPGKPLAANVPWTDNQAQTGHVLANSFHLQPYYPLAQYFPAIDTGTVTFTGTLITGHIDRSEPSQISSYQRGFGYVDNTLVGSGSPTLPDNPYTPTVEGGGGDAFDIDWAIDAQGNPVHLDGIDFIKVYTAINADAGWLGEISTEIRGIIDIAPAPSITGPLERVILADIPSQTGIGTTVNLEAHLFHKGKVQDHRQIGFMVSDAGIAEVTPSGKLLAKAPGKVTVTAFCQDDPSLRDQTTVQVIAPSKVSIALSGTSLRVEGRQEVSAIVSDQNGSPVTGAALSWQVSDTAIMTLSPKDEKLFVEGKSTGEAWLSVSVVGLPGLRDSLRLKVLPATDSKQVYLTLKGPEGIILPRKQITVHPFDLNAYVDNPRQDYGPDHIAQVTLAHAIAQPFGNAAFLSDLRFRDDDQGGQGLYLWRVPQGDATNLRYIYGYGGSKAEGHDRAWLVRVNQHTYIKDLHNIKIKEGDEITAYWIEGVAQDWAFTHIKSDRDSIETDEAITITATRSRHSLTEDRSVATISSEAVAGAEIKVDGKPYENNETPVLTDELGQATILFSQGGIKEVQVAGEVLQLFIQGDLTVGLPERTEVPFSVSPNPFHEHLRLSNLEAIHFPLSHEVLSLDGKVLISGATQDPTEGITIDTHALPPGTYILLLRSRKEAFHLKLLKP